MACLTRPYVVAGDSLCLSSVVCEIYSFMITRKPATKITRNPTTKYSYHNCSTFLEEIRAKDLF